MKLVLMGPFKVKKNIDFLAFFVVENFIAIFFQFLENCKI